MPALNNEGSPPECANVKKKVEKVAYVSPFASKEGNKYEALPHR